MVFSELQVKIQMLPRHIVASRTEGFLAESKQGNPSARHTVIRATNKTTRIKCVANMSSNSRFTVVIYGMSDAHPYSEIICVDRADLGLIADKLVMFLPLRTPNTWCQELFAEVRDIGATSIPALNTWANRRRSLLATPRWRSTTRQKKAAFRSNLRAAKPLPRPVPASPHRKNPN